AVFFLDIKTFIAPAFANSLKIREDLRMERGRFHISVVTAIFLAIGVSIVASLIMAYGRGANGLQSWFYSGFTADFFTQIKNINQHPPGASGTLAGWVLAGATAMGLL